MTTPAPPETMPSGLLLQETRDTLMALGRHPEDRTLSRRAEALEAEVSRRMAW